MTVALRAARRGFPLVLLALALLALAAPAQARPSRSFFGLQAWTTPSQAEFKTISRAGTGSFRAVLVWGGVERSPGDRDWSSFDAVVERAARSRLSVLPVIAVSPRWASANPLHPPLSPAARGAFARFVADATARYRPRGRFWSENRALPYRPVRAWQVWNEPNLPAYWGKPSARGYASLLRIAAKAVRSSDRGAKVVLAGLPETANGVPMSRYLASLYRIRGLRRAFDVVAVHPYARDQRGVVAAVVRARRIMSRARDSRTPVWVTELGFASGGGRSPFASGPRGQATRLIRSYRELIRKRRRLRIGAAYWFSWRDTAPALGRSDWWALNTGLVNRRGAAKPALRAYRRAAGGR